MSNNYDPVASYYDQLNHLIFGRATLKPQEWLIQHLPPGASILIAGGGTGWILEAIAARIPDGLQIDYVESSAKMMAQAKNKYTAKNKVSYILSPVEVFEPSRTYDVIITPYLLDNFSMSELKLVISRLKRLLRKDGIWLVADFYKSSDRPWWQPAILWLMYRFFRLLCGITAQKLPDYPALFTEHGFLERDTRFFYNRFLFAGIYSIRPDNVIH